MIQKKQGKRSPDAGPLMDDWTVRVFGDQKERLEALVPYMLKYSEARFFGKVTPSAIARKALDLGLKALENERAIMEDRGTDDHED